jgi:hypothetical protein
MVVRGKSGLDDDITLLGPPLPLLGEIGIQAFFDIFDHVVPGLRHLAGGCKMVSESGEIREPKIGPRASWLDIFGQHLFLKVLPS